MRNAHSYYLSPKRLQDPRFDIEFSGGSKRSDTPEAKAEARRVLKSRVN